MKAFNIVGMLLLTLCAMELLWAQAGDDKMRLEAEVEYRQKLEDLDQRYQDFHIHEQEKSRQKLLRDQSAGEHKEKRNSLKLKKEAARKSFIRPKPDVRDESEHLAALERLKKRKNKERTLYVGKRRRLDRIKESAKKIPQEREVGLED